MTATPDFEMCDAARQTIEAALNGFHTPGELSQIRNQLAKCEKCLRVYDLEVSFRFTMAQRTRESAPQDLQIRISQALQRVDMGDLNITDF